MQITAERRVKLTQLIVHGDLSKYQAGGQMLAVLELAGGTAAKLGRRPGDRVVSVALQPADQ